MDFSEMLTQWMARQKLTGADAAERLGVSASTITRWLKGQGVPAIKRVDELAVEFGVSGTEVALAILGGVGKTDPLTKLETLVSALLARLEGLEVRQQTLEADLTELRRRKR